jgi:hypothetical protein
MECPTSGNLGSDRMGKMMIGVSSSKTEDASIYRRIGR